MNVVGDDSTPVEQIMNDKRESSNTVKPSREVVPLSGGRGAIGNNIVTAKMGFHDLKVASLLGRRLKTGDVQHSSTSRRTFRMDTIVGVAIYRAFQNHIPHRVRDRCSVCSNLSNYGTQPFMAQTLLMILKRRSKDVMRTCVHWTSGGSLRA